MTPDVPFDGDLPPRRIEVLDGTTTYPLSVEALLAGLLAAVPDALKVHAITVALQVQAHLDDDPTLPLQIRANRIVRPGGRPELDGGAA